LFVIVAVSATNYDIRLRRRMCHLHYFNNSLSFNFRESKKNWSGRLLAHVGEISQWISTSQICTRNSMLSSWKPLNYHVPIAQLRKLVTRMTSLC